jgi:hypothetical protein
MWKLDLKFNLLLGTTIKESSVNIVWSEYSIIPNVYLKDYIYSLFAIPEGFKFFLEGGVTIILFTFSIIF